jgi:hypothetical protein
VSKVQNLTSVQCVAGAACSAKCSARRLIAAALGEYTRSYFFFVSRRLCYYYITVKNKKRSVDTPTQNSTDARDLIHSFGDLCFEGDLI